METITIKTEKVTRQEVEQEVTLPFYSKKEECFYKVESEDRIITVWLLSTSARISVRSINIELGEALRAEPSTQEEFQEAFMKAFKLINNSN